MRSGGGDGLGLSWGGHGRGAWATGGGAADAWMGEVGVVDSGRLESVREAGGGRQIGVWVDFEEIRLAIGADTEINAGIVAAAGRAGGAAGQGLGAGSPGRGG